MRNAQSVISVIIPVYNVEDYLERCVYSVVNQSYTNLEIILIDDGSTDGSGSMCDQLALNDSRIIVIHKENGGLSSARNTGLDICKGEYISFIDSDDWIESEMYEKMLDSIETHSTLIACCGRNDVTNDTKKRGLCPEKSGAIDSKEAIQRILNWNNMDSSACDKLFHKSIWMHFRFPDGRISEDVAIMYKIIDFAERIALVSSAYYNYYHRLGSITTSEFNPKSLDIIKNVEEMESFINSKYTSLIDDFAFFKYIEYAHLLALLAQNKSGQYKKEEYYLCRKLKLCSVQLNKLGMKQKIRLYFFKNIVTYNLIYKPWIRIKISLRKSGIF